MRSRRVQRSAPATSTAGRPALAHGGQRWPPAGRRGGPATRRPARAPACPIAPCAGSSCASGRLRTSSSDVRKSASGLARRQRLQPDRRRDPGQHVVAGEEQVRRARRRTRGGRGCGRASATAVRLPQLRHPPPPRSPRRRRSTRRAAPSRRRRAPGARSGGQAPQQVVGAGPDASRRRWCDRSAEPGAWISSRPGCSPSPSRIRAPNSRRRRHGERVVVAVRVGDQEPAHVAEARPEPPSAASSRSRASASAQPGVDEGEAVAVGDRVDVHRAQAVVRQRQRDAVDVRGAAVHPGRRPVASGSSSVTSGSPPRTLHGRA